MKMRFTVEVEVERVTGKFISRAALEEEVQGWLDGCNEGSVSVDDSEYDVTVFDVTTD